MDNEAIATVAQEAPNVWHALYWIAVWWFGCGAGIAMAHLDRNWRTCTDLLATGVASGFLAFGVVSVSLWCYGPSPGDGPVWLGIAGATGLAGKYRDKIILGFASGIAGKLQAAAAGVNGNTNNNRIDD